MVSRRPLFALLLSPPILASASSAFVAPRAASFVVSASQRALASRRATVSAMPHRMASTQQPATTFSIDAPPAPGNPFHLAFPVRDIEESRKFYGDVLGCTQGRIAPGKWVDYSLAGHQIVCHWAGNDYKCQDYYNPVDGDDVPVPHFGLALPDAEWHALAKRVEEAGIHFIVKPHLRFKGMPGEQWTMFFKDPSGNNLEFKSMTTPGNLFARYDVVD